MKRKQEKNVHAFNTDVRKTGQYLYTDLNNYSAVLATKRQTTEIISVINRYIPERSTILDVGCGDGVLTTELFNAIKPKKIVGFDKAKWAITFAKKRIKKKDKTRIVFQYGDVYKSNSLFKGENFDVVIIRGLLHHLYQPELAIKSLSALSDNIVVLEPNGYNLILKIIEKISPYHRDHEEKSYWPPTLNRWFINNNYYVVMQSYSGIVPYFCPTFFAKLLKLFEPIIEKIPYVNMFACGTNVVYYKRKQSLHNK